MKILALEKEMPGRSAADFQPFLKAEAEHIWQLTQQGVIREINFHSQEHTAVIMLECGEENEAASLLAEFPLARAGLIEFDVLPLAPYAGFERLFAD